MTKGMPVYGEQRFKTELIDLLAPEIERKRRRAVRAERIRRLFRVGPRCPECGYRPGQKNVRIVLHVSDRHHRTYVRFP